MKLTLYRSAPFALIVIVAYATLAHADVKLTQNYVRLHLPCSATLVAPSNWSIINNDRRITIETAVDAILELSKKPNPEHNVPLMANHYDPSGKTDASMDIRYYPKHNITQSEMSTLTENDVREMTPSIRQEYEKQHFQGIKSEPLKWRFIKLIKKRTHTALLTSYEWGPYEIYGERYPWRNISYVYKVYNGKDTFVITVSYRKDLAHYFEPISQMVLKSIELTH